MSTYARIQDNTVAELFTPPQGATLAQCFHADIVAQFVDVTAIAPAPQPGWTYDGESFAAPVAPSPTSAQQAQIMIAAG
ncbi:MAG TPA: hypothetical protein VHA37_09860, partial [Candidatus Saccharimonadales bacterium]|nr:hypothetical protein [Candidatus Saccharimonadales bacterium]